MHTHLGFATLGSLALGLAGCVSPFEGVTLFAPGSGSDCLSYVDDAEVTFEEAEFVNPGKPESPDVPVSERGSAWAADVRMATVEAFVGSCFDGVESWDSIAVDLDLPEGTQALLSVRGEYATEWQPVGEVHQGTSLPLGIDDEPSGLQVRVDLFAQGVRVPQIRSALVQRTCNDALEGDGWYDDGC